MLHFGARLIGDSVAASRSVAAQSQLPQHACQCGIANLNSLFLDQLLVHPLNPTVALVVQTLVQLGVNLNLVVPLFPSDLSLLSDDGPHRMAADVQAAADFP